MEYQFNEAQEAWLKALESGEYQQAMGNLHDGRGYCCLGIGCVVIGLPFSQSGYRYLAAGNECLAPRQLINELKLRGEDGDVAGLLLVNGNPYRTLTSANDFGESFVDIARAVRSNPTAVFKE